VIHTGGGEHLARLIREGVQALLGGNAIAVHDIEQNLMGTSLDMKRGVAAWRTPTPSESDQYHPSLWQHC